MLVKQADSQLKLFWNQIEDTYFRWPGKVQSLHQLNDLNPLASTAAGRTPTVSQAFASAEAAQIHSRATVNQQQASLTSDNMHVPNRQLRQGENLLELWDKKANKVAAARALSTTQKHKMDKLGKKKREAASASEIAALIGPQKLSQWMGQIAQADSFGDYLDSRFAYLDELNQDFTLTKQEVAASASAAAVVDQACVGEPSQEQLAARLDYELLSKPRKRQKRAIAAPTDLNPSIKKPQQPPSKKASTFSTKKNVDSLIKDLEKELGAVQMDVLDGFNKLERKVQCYRKPKSQLLIEQKNNCAERYLEQLIIEMEMQQLAESVVQITAKTPVLTLPCKASDSGSKKSKLVCEDVRRALTDSECEHEPCDAKFNKALAETNREHQIFSLNNQNNRPFLLLEKEKSGKQLKKTSGASGKKRANQNSSAMSAGGGSSKFPAADKRWNYRIKFDPSLQLDEIWVDSQTLDYLNSFRENIFVSQGFPIASPPDTTSTQPQASQAVQQSQSQKPTRNQPKRQSKLHSAKDGGCSQSNDTRSTAASQNQNSRRQRGDNSKSGTGSTSEQYDGQYGYCHHCKQLKKTSLLAECKYDSDKMGLQQPISYTVSDVTIFNVDMLNYSSLTHLVLKEMQVDSKQNCPSSASLLNKSFNALAPKILNLPHASQHISNLKRHLELSQKPQYRCNRQFCHACLKLCYDDDFNVCKNNRSWICHFCYGVCFCTRCLRQDVITQNKAYYIGMGGNLASIEYGVKSKSLLDRVIFDSFQAHLWLTLLSNVHLLVKYPNFMAIIDKTKSEQMKRALAANQTLPLVRDAGSVNFADDSDDSERCQLPARKKDGKRSKLAGAAFASKSASFNGQSPQNLIKLTKLLEYSVMAQASEDPKFQISASELSNKNSKNAPATEKQQKSKKKNQNQQAAQGQIWMASRKPNESIVLQAVQMNQPSLLMLKGRPQSNSKIQMKKNKKLSSAASLDLNLIRSDGKKRKFFFRDSQLRKNLNKRQLKQIEKAQKLRRTVESKVLC